MDQFPSAVVALSQAMLAGEDCYFALHDALLEAGQPDLATCFVTKQSADSPVGRLALHKLIGKFAWLPEVNRLILCTNHAEEANGQMPARFLDQNTSCQYLAAVKQKFQPTVVALPKDTKAASDILHSCYRELLDIGSPVGVRIEQRRGALAPSSEQECVFFLIGAKPSCLRLALPMLLFLESDFCMSEWRVDVIGRFAPFSTYHDIETLEAWVARHPKIAAAMNL
jgi:hypothetical protein